MYSIQTMCTLKVLPSGCGYIGFFGVQFMELCATLFSKYTAHYVCSTCKKRIRDVLDKCYIFRWCLVPLQGLFPTMVQKCHSACWSGLDSGQKAKKREKKMKWKSKKKVLDYMSNLDFLAFGSSVSWVWIIEIFSLYVCTVCTGLLHFQMSLWVMLLIIRTVD